MIHRDLKPENILYTGTPGVPTMKLADFGLCRIVKGDQIQTAQSLTTDGTYSKRVVRAGTDGWMAPEMHNANQFTSASDIFPLGLICGFTLAKGQHPFDDKHPKLMMAEEMKKKKVEEKMKKKVEEEEAGGKHQTLMKEILGEIQQKRKSRITEEDEAKRNKQMQKFTRQFSDSRVYKLIEWMLKKEPEARPNVLKILDDLFFELDTNIPLDFSQDNYHLAKQVNILNLL